MFTFLLWCILFILSWPVALAAGLLVAGSVGDGAAAEFLAGDYDTNFIEQEYHPRALATADGKPDRLDDDKEFTAAMLAVAAAAQNLGNGRSPEASGAGRGAAGGGSAWKTLGRLDVLRR